MDIAFAWVSLAVLLDAGVMDVSVVRTLRIALPNNVSVSCVAAVTLAFGNALRHRCGVVAMSLNFGHMFAPLC
jgi:hypothetical protein